MRTQQTKKPNSPKHSDRVLRRDTTFLLSKHNIAIMLYHSDFGSEVHRGRAKEQKKHFHGKHSSSDHIHFAQPVTHFLVVRLYNVFNVGS